MTQGREVFIDEKAAKREGLISIRCLNTMCNEILAYCGPEGKSLRLNGKDIPFRKVMLTCKCGRRRTWRRSADAE